MRKLLVIVRREYLTRVRTRAFLIGTLASPIILAGITLLPLFIVGRGSGERHVVILNQSGDPALFDNIRRMAESSIDQHMVTPGDDQFRFQDRATGDARFIMSEISAGATEDLEQIRQRLNQEIGREPERSYILLRPGVLDGVDPEYYASNVSDLSIRDLRRVVSSAITQRRLVLAGFDPRRAEEFTRPVEMKIFRVSSEGETQGEGYRVFQIAFVMLVFIYVTVMAYGMTVMRGVIEEKQSRIIEVIVSSVKPFQIMLGKLTGIALVGLTQYGIWIGLIVLLSVYGASIFGTAAALPGVTPALLMYFVLFFLLGYFLYASLYLTVGAIASNEDEAQYVQIPIMMLLVAPMILFSVILNNPSSTVAVLLSIVPFFAPTLMLLRIVVASPPLWQIAISVALMLISIALTLWLAARIYRVGILMYGKRAGLGEIGRWLRHS